MPRAALSPLSLLLLVSAALALASCGGEDAQLLPGATAREITDNLEKVRELNDEGDCVGAESAARQVGEQIEALGNVDRRLKRALAEGAARLNEVIAECEEAAEAEVTPAPEATEEEPAKKPKKEGKPKPEKKPKAPPAEKETPSSTGELPPQANGEGKGLEKGKGPPESEGEPEGPPSGGVAPGSAVEEGE